jgi:CubicO group peptidase (beta-lactamase class C family)
LTGKILIYSLQSITILIQTCFMKKFVTRFLSILIFYTLPAQQVQIQKADGKTISSSVIDLTVARLMSKADVEGLAIGIINNNQPVYVKSYGFKNKPRNQLNDTASIFYGASFSKALFGVIVMQLVEDGKLDLDKPLYTYLSKPIPEYNYYKDLEADERWKLITARHCLAHTTGFPNWRQFNPRGNKKLEIFFTPGERYAYSGEGIFLLHMAVEAITGRKLDDLATEKVFKPSGMYRSSYVWQSSFENNYAIGHDINGDILPKRKRAEANAAGSLETTIADYTRFFASLMNRELLSDKSYREMLSPQIRIYTKRQFPSLNNDTTSANRSIQLSYGLGWGLFKSSYGQAFFKEGHDDGWVHYSIGFPEQKMALVIMSNSFAGESIYKELVEKLTGVTIPWEWEGYIPYRPTVKVKEEILQQYAGVYEGRLKAIVSVVDGKLKVESETVGLPKTTLYAAAEDLFFLKVMETDIRFVKGPDGKIEKAVLNDEGEHYELKKVK